MPTQVWADKDAGEFFRELQRGQDRVGVMVFLCGTGITPRPKSGSRRGRVDLRLFMEEKLNSIPQCKVHLGEHRDMSAAHKAAVGRSSNLATYEMDLAGRRRTDLIVIFPCSPGSFAELGMFTLRPKIARKMVVFVDKNRYSERSFLGAGVLKEAKRKAARIHFVDYRDRPVIWNAINEEIKEKKADKYRGQADS